MRNLIIAGALLAAATSPGATMSAQTASAPTIATPVESRNKAIVEKRFTAWKAGTGSPYDLLAETATWTIVGRSLASKTLKDDQVVKAFAFVDSVAFNEFWTRVSPSTH